MRYSFTALVLATFIVGQAMAGHFHVPRHRATDSIVQRRQPVADYANSSLATTQVTSLLSATAPSKLVSLDVQIGTNDISDNGAVWIGSGGTYTNAFTNKFGEDLILVIWGRDESWVNVNKPFITIEIPVGGTQLISFASGIIGAWSAIYPDTTTVDGQISNTWGEFTMSPEGVVDVSRLVNMTGHAMTISSPQCTTDMTTCVFVCLSGLVCETSYELLNCAAGSQPGAQYGNYGGSPSGGCGGLGNSAALTTYLL